MTELQIVYRRPSELAPAHRNPRTHSQAQIGKLMRSIEQFGFNNPVLIDRDGHIVAGHGRVEAASALKLASIPTVLLEHLTPEQRRAYVIADNRLAELSGWDDELLALELGDLSAIDLGFDVTDVGFEIGEIDVLIGRGSGPSAAKVEADDEVPAFPSGNLVCRRGDLWALGVHRLFCGDALDTSSYLALLDEAQVDMVFTDPPYNVPIVGNVSGLGKTKHREFAMASGEMNANQFTTFLRTAFQQMAAASAEGSLHYICMDWRHLTELLSAGKATYSDLKNLCVWVKSNGGMGSLYRSQHELVSVWKKGTDKHLNNVELGKHGRHRTNVWHYPGMTSFHKGRDEALASHPTCKPVALVADAILDCTARRALVLDPFSGSGSTIMAAERTGRRARAIELDPRYVDVTLRRFRNATGIEPVNLWTGQQLAEVLEQAVGA